MSSITPTSQQNDIRDAVATGETVVVEAMAGTGKTSTLNMIARDRPHTPMSYTAFNKAIAEEGQRRFPRNVTVRTAHAFAYAHVTQTRPELLERLRSQARVPNWKVADILNIQSFAYGHFKLRDRKLAGLVKEAVARFCHSAHPAPEPWMIPVVPGLETPEARRALNEHLFRYVQRAWQDMTSANGRLQFTHDVYLKLASMDPDFRLPGEVILFDEAQDADPVVKLIVERQAREHGAQLIPVGDSNQQIYEWRGAVDALAQFETDYRMPLTQSFRFGPEIAEEANRILELLPTDLRVEGFERVQSRLAHLDDPDVVLCRTNAEAIARLLEAQVSGVSAGLVGGTGAVEALARAALDLSEGRETYHPELQAFESWNQVQEYVEDEPEARDLQVLVRIVDTHGAEKLLDAVQHAVPEQAAQLLVSTAHKAKGREWSRVQLANDFPPPVKQEGGFSHSELRLEYVAVTRAKDYLDSSSLSWLGSVAHRMGQQREFLAPNEVPVRAARRTVEVANVMCDPEAPNRLIMTGTKYDPDLVEAQKALPADLRPNYRAEYAGFQKVRIVLASHRVLQVVEQFGLSITNEARERIAEYS